MWTRLDDKIRSHPKVVAAGPLASWLYVCGLSYAGEHLTDGFIPSRVVPTLATFEGIRIRAEDRLLETWEPVDTAVLTKTLVDVGLWQPVDGGFLIPKYTLLNGTKEERESKSGQRAAGRRRADSATRLADGRFAPDPPAKDGGLGSEGPDRGPGSPEQTRTSDPASQPRPDQSQVVDRSLDGSVGVGSGEGELSRAEILAGLQGLGFDSDVAHLLSKLAFERRPWQLLVQDPDALRELRELPASALAVALGQAVDTLSPGFIGERIRRPLGWLRIVVPEIVAERGGRSETGSIRADLARRLGTWLFAFLLGVLVAIAVPGEGHRAHETPRCDFPKLSPRSGPPKVERFIRCMARVTPGVAPGKAVAVASCESGMRPRATNGSHDGVYSQADRYWADRAAQYGFPGHSAFDPRANVTVSLRMVRDKGWIPDWAACA